MNRRYFIGLAAAATATACSTRPTLPVSSDITLFRPEGAAAFPAGASLETLGEGYQWSEGPIWDGARDRLLFTDVPANTAYSWSEARGVETYLAPSNGLSGEGAPTSGANGLWFTRDGGLLLANHGARSLDRLDPASKARTALVTRFEGKRFSSPNDVVEARDGTIYFTDPPYGLEGQDDSPLKEMAVNGVYRLSPSGGVERILDDMTRPNGVALSPDEATLYITQSDRDAPILRAFDLATGSVRTIQDFAPDLAAGIPGLPDGLCVATTGEIFVTGPGGVYLLGSDGERLARVETGVATANCAFGGSDGSDLYITAHTRLQRIPTRLKGVQWG